MKSEDNLVYYSEQGSISSPGEYMNLVAGLPKDMVKLCSYIHQLILIDFLPNMGLVKVPPEHLEDIQIRGVKKQARKGNRKRWFKYFNRKKL